MARINLQRRVTPRTQPARFPWISIIYAKALRRKFLLFLLAFIVVFYMRRSFLNDSNGFYHTHGSKGPLFTENKFPIPRCNESVGRDDDQEPISANHRYAPDGLVYVDPDGMHPILELVKKAEEEWENKLHKASRNLKSAVAEYKRRYKRAPPLGFDDWWDFAHEMEVELPDEYDTIWRELEPLWGINPKDLAKIQALQETKPDSFTLAKNETHDTNLAGTAFSNTETWEQRGLLRGLEQILELLEPVEPALPHFRATFSPHGTPNLLSDYYVKKATLDAAKKKKYVDISRLPKIKHLGFVSACAPGSPARPVEKPINQLTRPPPRTEKTFIHNHRLSMDPCLHPHIFHHHTQYVAHDLGPAPQPTMAAQFSYSTTPLFHDIQPPSFLEWTPEIGPRERDPEWEERMDNRLLWRGSNTGMSHNDATRWRHAHRTHLISWANDFNGSTNVLLPGNTKDEGWERVGPGTTIKKALLNPAILDVAFSGKPVGCDVQYCRYLETQFEWKSEEDADRKVTKVAKNHKYIVDVDGNGWSSQFKQLMESNALVFKATAYSAWWLDRSQPWVHYVPVQVDYSDLYDTYVFFQGGLYGEGNHDNLAKKIAYAGKEWSGTFWRHEDMTVYFFRLLLEYARVMSPDREAMSYSG